MTQDKPQPEENDVSFSRAATPDWIIWVAPFGRVVKRSYAVLRLLARTRHYRRDAPGGFYALWVQPLHNSLNPSIQPCWSTSPARVFGAVRDGAALRVRRWARKRQGLDQGTINLRPGRVYILPTGVGLVFAVMAFAMLLGSMNYNNNLSFVLTFILIGIGFVSMHQCQRNLVGLQLSFAGTASVFAGQSMQFRIAVANQSKSPRYGIRLYSDTAYSEIHDLRPGESRIFVLPVATEQRGWIALHRFGIRTLFPFELFRSWAWLHMDLRGLVFPCPAEQPPEPPPTLVAHGHRQHDARGEEDFAGLRKYQQGDSPRHVAWKAYARSGQLFSKQFAGADTSSQWLDFKEIAVDDVEARLSILTSWVVQADRKLEDYGLRIPGQKFAPAHGEVHRRQCLEALALFDSDKS